MSDETEALPAAPGEEEEVYEHALRPRAFADYVGQARVIENLEVAIEAAKARGEPLDHLLFHGPPGLGKTSLAHLIAREMGVGFRATSGPVVERPGDLAAILTGLEEGSVLFIDEIHRLSRTIEEVLYPAMEDYEIDLIVGQGPGASTVKLTLAPFTLVGATTRSGLLSRPLRNRFGTAYRLEFYSTPELVRILVRSARLLGVELRDGGADEIARRSRGTPRISNRLLRHVRDWAQVRASGVIDREVAADALERLAIDERGLDEMQRALLLTIIDRFDGGPVGLETLAASLGEERDTVEDVYEPYLLQEGLIARQPRGRVATAMAYEHLGREPGGGGGQGRLL